MLKVRSRLSKFHLCRNQEYERYLFIGEHDLHWHYPSCYAHIQSDTTSGHTQWDPPTPEDARIDATTSLAAQTSRPARRQYAAGQTQAYSGDATAQTGGYNAADPSGQAGGQLFTPGLEGDNQFAAQQQQQPQGQFFSPVAQPVAYGTSGPDYGQRPSYSNSGVDQLAGQFSNMNVQSQKGFSLQNINLLTTPSEPAELHRPPPEIRLPPGACISTSPFALPDPSYQRCTLNAIPTTNSLLGKSKMPLALVLTPYRSVPEGEPEVPVVADQVIARCRRCRTYINPYVQFIDNGNRFVTLPCSSLGPSS
jgi:protein transport protein SEC24